MKMFKEKNIISNERGSSLMMAMISAAIIGGMIFVMMQSKKTAVYNQNKETADRDVDRAAADLGSMLANPAHCNATFVGVTLPPTDSNPASATYKLSSSSLSLTTGFKKCTAAYPGTCTTGSPTTTVLSFNDSSWKLFKDSSLEAKEYARAKITQADYKIIRPQTMQLDTQWAPSGKALPATLELTVVFTKLMGRTSSGTEITAFSRPYKFEFYVITGRFYDNTTPDPSPPINPATGAAFASNAPHLNPTIPTSIIGCARSPDSTLVY
jgi:hypothetical protein